MTSRAEVELVELAASGDVEAFAELYRLRSRMVYALAFEQIRDAEHAADIVQETFLRALAKLHALRDPERFGSWVYSIAKNAINDHLRRVMREGPDVAPDKAAPIEDPVEGLSLLELSATVQGAIGGLSARDATALRLSTDLGAGPSDIAEALGISTGAAKVMLHRARRRLRQSLMLETLLRAPQSGCEEFHELLTAGGGRSIAVHVGECDECEHAAKNELGLYAMSPCAGAG